MASEITMMQESPNTQNGNEQNADEQMKLRQLQKMSTPGIGSILTPSQQNEFIAEYRDFVEDLRQRCLKARDAQFLAAKNWNRNNLALGLSATLSGVIGGGSAAITVVGGQAWSAPLAAVLSTSAGLLAAANSFFKSSDQEEAHKRAGDEWSILRDKFAKLGKLETFITSDPGALIARLSELLDLKEEVTKKSPVVSERVYKKIEEEYKEDPPGKRLGH